jgi:myosin heavy subunit
MIGCVSDSFADEYICCWQDIKSYKLGDPSSFHYLNQSTCIKLDEISDAKEYLATRSAMNTVGITEQEQVSGLCIFRLIVEHVDMCIDF